MNTTVKVNIASDTIELSPSSIKVLNSCKARWVYENLILPKIETERTREITRFGSLFHQIAEHNFERSKIGSMMFAEKLSVRKELEQYAERVKERFYFELPSVNEQFMKVELEQGFILRGIPDRICYSENIVYIVDYKTAAIPDPMKDKMQGLSYIYLLSRLEDIDVKKIALILDYVKADEVYPA
jgi:RecB family exonuclease